MSFISCWAGPRVWFPLNMYLCIYLSINLSIHLSFYISTYLPACLPVCVSDGLSVFLHQNIPAHIQTCTQVEGLFLVVRGRLDRRWPLPVDSGGQCSLVPLAFTRGWTSLTPGAWPRSFWSMTARGSPVKHVAFMGLLGCISLVDHLFQFLRCFQFVHRSTDRGP